MMHPVDNKQNWLGIRVESVKPGDVYSKKDLIQLGEGSGNAALFVLGYASTWTMSDSEKPAAKKQKTEASSKEGSGPGPSDAANAFIRVPWIFERDFKLFFYATVGIEGGGNSVPLIVEKTGLNDAPSLPWQIFGKSWDALNGSEMPCLSFVIPAVKKGKSGKGDKIKTGQFIKDGSAGGGPASASAKAKASAANNCKEIADQIILGKPKAKAKTKKKAAPKEKKNDQTLSDAIKFIEAPMFLELQDAIVFFC